MPRQGLNTYRNGERRPSLSPEQREREILSNVHLVKRITDRIAMKLPSHVETEDLHSAGIIGLIDAIEKYDPAKGVPFETYAEFRIRGAVFDELRSLDDTPRSVRTLAKRVEEVGVALEARFQRVPTDEEMAEALGTTLEAYQKTLLQINSTLTLSLNQVIGDHSGHQRTELIESLVDDKTRSPFDHIELDELKRLLSAAIDELPDRYRIVLALYYFEELNMKEVAQVLDVTESRISQIHAKCMLILKRKIRAVLGGAA